jgi:hypothetical protein
MALERDKPHAAVNTAMNLLLLMISFTTVSFSRTTLIFGVKAAPLQAWTGPQGSRRLTLLDFKTVGT